MRRNIAVRLAMALAAAAVAAAHAAHRPPPADAIFAFSCKSGLGHSLTVVNTQPGTLQYAFTSKGLRVREPAGIGAGSICFPTQFSVAGDFTINLTAARAALGHAYLGLSIGNEADAALIDIFFDGPATIQANVFNPVIPGSFTPSTHPEAAKTVKFVLTRTGNVISAGYLTPRGFVAVAKTPDLAEYGVPALIDLFLIEAGNDTAEHTGTFDTLRIASPSLANTCK